MKRKRLLQPIFAVRSNVAVRGDSSPCSRCLGLICMSRIYFEQTAAEKN